MKISKRSMKRKRRESQSASCQVHNQGKDQKPKWMGIDSDTGETVCAWCLWDTIVNR